MADFSYSPMFPLAADTTEYELVSSDHVKLVEIGNEQFLRVAAEGLTELAERALPIFRICYEAAIWPSWHRFWTILEPPKMIALWQWRC